MLKNQYEALKIKLKSEHLETCESHKLYTTGSHILIDISPGDEFQFFRKKTLESRVNHMWQLFKPHFDLIHESSSKYEISMEISKMGRIHFHSNLIVVFGSQIAHEIARINYLYTVRIDVDTIKDPLYRDAYIRKDTDENLRFLRYTETDYNTNDSESDTDSSASQ